MKKRRPFLKWAGGKYSLLDEIRRHLPEGECLIEPFLGAGAVFLNTNYSRYILADINSDLIDLYKIIKTKANEYIKESHKLFTTRNNRADAYYVLREEFNLSKESFRRALIFLYLNRHCYNGLCRYNLNGDFNVPFGRYRQPQLPEEALYTFAERAQQAEFYCESYQQSMARATEGCVVYCDPPYTPLSATANFTSYHVHTFCKIQQEDLALRAEILQSKNIPVLISNHDTPLTRQWYQKAKQHVVGVQRNISGNRDTRKKVDELLALYPVNGQTEKQSTINLPPTIVKPTSPDSILKNHWRSQ